MSGIKFVLDTNAVIKLIDSNMALGSLDSAFINAEQYISVINRIELFADPKMTEEEELNTGKFLTNVIIVPIDEVVEAETIKIRRADTSIKLPDAIIAATAVALGAILLTNDDKLLKLSWPKLIIQNL
ncbi:MAG: PIN domain-containing protein [Spirochaetaceae bacterium]|jgi:predicted nucleic acid-binding protein|nr:PIN domain-containing protein [Spirochaetaceae bacterium]